ncbi:MAG: hypothetical protein GF332_01715 [Candidatus Moranbacteria bacterium]|nr:hypothetical protein [Candidatus Moranbacteria bacterium]
MNNRFLQVALILGVIVIVLTGLYYIKKSKTQAVTLDDNSYYLFVGEGCDHCQKVEEHILEHKLREKLAIQIMEVFKKTENQNFYFLAFDKCGKDEPKTVSVPVLYHNGKCLTGDQDIIQELGE